MRTFVIKSIFSLSILISFFACDIINDDSEDFKQDCELINSQNLANCESGSSDYNYCLIDVNPNSCTYGKDIGKSIFTNQVTLHYFGHQNWNLCKTRVGNLDALYQDFINEGIDNVRIIAIGKGQYSSDNSNWTEGNSIPIVADPSPNTLWTSWGASQWDVFFLDSSGEYVTDFNIKDWDYNKVYNQIKDILPK